MTNDFTETQLKTPWFIPTSESAIPTNLASPLVSSVTSQTSSTLSHLPLANPRAYHRSKLITATTGINPLLTAATALFAYVTQLRAQTTCENVTELYQELQHEIKAFEAQAQTLGYRSDIILLARYLLCALLDETILTTAWGQHSQWHQHKLLHFFHNEDWGGERFFVILKRLSADPALHIDMLELTYLCLSLGFTGKYQFIENAYIELEQITETLYQCIRWQRGDIKKELAILTTANNNLTTKVMQPLLPLWLLSSLTVTLISSFYMGFNFLLGQAAAPLYSTLLQTYG